MSKLEAGRELDREVALKVLGWTLLSGPYPNTEESFKKQYWNTWGPNYLTVPDYHWFVGTDEDGDPFILEFPRCSTSIKIAFDEIVHHINIIQPHWYFELITDKLKGKREWLAVFDKLHVGTADTPEVAICYAALKASKHFDGKIKRKSDR